MKILIAIKFLVLPFCLGKEIPLFEIFMPEYKCVCSFMGTSMQSFVPKRSKVHLEYVEK